MSIIEKFLKTSRYDKPHGIFLLFIPCVWGLFLSFNNLKDVIFYSFFFFVGSAGMRALGCIWNDFNDKKFDIKVARTKNRLIAKNKVNNLEIILYSIINTIIGITPLFVLPLHSILIAFCVLPLIISYPFMKRITWWPQLWLGLNFNWGILVASSIVSYNFLSDSIVFFYFGAVLWTVAYDTIYGFQDIKDDLIIGVKSTSIKFKEYPKVFLFFTYILSVSLWIISFVKLNKAPSLILLILIILITLLTKIIFTDLKDINACKQAFVYNSYYGLTITLIMLFYL